MYQEYLKNKEDNAENEGAVWLTPQSSKEIEEASKALYYELLMLNACATTFDECSKNKILFSQLIFLQVLWVALL